MLCQFNALAEFFKEKPEMMSIPTQNATTIKTPGKTFMQFFEPATFLLL